MRSRSSEPKLQGQSARECTIVLNTIVKDEIKVEDSKEIAALWVPRVTFFTSITSREIKLRDSIFIPQYYYCHDSTNRGGSPDPVYIEIPQLEIALS